MAFLLAWYFRVILHGCDCLVPWLSKFATLLTGISSPVIESSLGIFSPAESSRVIYHGCDWLIL